MATLLYGAETWTVYRVQVRKLHAYMMRHLRAIMNISRKDKITNIEVLKRAGLPSMEDMLIQMNLRRLGHIERMDHQRLPRQLLYSQLCEGKRNLGWPRLRFKDTVKNNLEKLDIGRSSWKQRAKGRAAWRNLISPKWNSHCRPRRLIWSWWWCMCSHIDRFASKLNAQIKTFVAWKPHPMAKFVDAFTINWSQFFFNAFPLFVLFPDVCKR